MNKKIIMILGASSDLGVALIKNIEEQFDVIIAHYNKSDERLKLLKNEIGEKLHIVKGDFSDISAIDEFIIKAKLICEWPTHIVHLPAQKVEYCKFTKTNWNDVERDMTIQAGSIYKILSYYIDKMAKNKYGKVVIMLSSNTISAPKYMAHYTIVKYALLGLMKSLAAEYSEKLININAVSPSMIETSFLSNLHHLVVEQTANENPMKRNALVGDVIPAIIFLLSDKADYISGENIVISGGSVL